MPGVVLSAVRNSVAARAIALSLGACTFMSGCGDKSTAEKNASEAAPATNSSAAPVGMFAADVAPKLTPLPEDRYAAGDRYAALPRVDPAVQPVGYAATPNAPTYAGPMPRPEPTRPAGRVEPALGSFGGPGVPQNPSEQPVGEDLQLLEQPDFKNYGKSPNPPAGYFSSSEMLNQSAKPTVRAYPLPLSP